MIGVIKAVTRSLDYGSSGYSYVVSSQQNRTLR